MQFFTVMTLLGAFTASAMAGVTPEVRDNCNNSVGDCFSNGCNGVFGSGGDTIGSCSAGRYAGCPCRKCGGYSGGDIGFCNQNGCGGYDGVCTQGKYEGCPCT